MDFRQILSHFVKRPWVQCELNGFALLGMWSINERKQRIVFGLFENKRKSKGTFERTLIVYLADRRMLGFAFLFVLKFILLKYGWSIYSVVIGCCFKMRKLEFILYLLHSMWRRNIALPMWILGKFCHILLISRIVLHL